MHGRHIEPSPSTKLPWDSGNSGNSGKRLEEGHHGHRPGSSAGGVGVQAHVYYAPSLCIGLGSLDP